MTRNMSLAIPADQQQFLKRVAEKRKISVSKLVRDLVLKCVGNEDEYYTVLLKIPVALKDDPAALKKWLEIRSAGIVKALTL